VTRRPWTRIRGQWWRVLVPKWAHDPLSGKGAALYGGRFNAAGDEALYLSGDVATAVAEYQNMIMARPGTFCVYELDVAGVVDAMDGAARRAWRIRSGDLTADWRAPAARGGQPLSWRLAKRLVAASAAGLRYPSLRRPGGVNLVLWRWNDGRGRRVANIDTLSDLPRDQSSWPPLG
jgi:RES domain-containing protein